MMNQMLVVNLFKGKFHFDFAKTKKQKNSNEDLSKQNIHSKKTQEIIFLQKSNKTNEKKAKLKFHQILRKKTL